MSLNLDDIKDREIGDLTKKMDLAYKIIDKLREDNHRYIHKLLALLKAKNNEHCTYVLDCKIVKGFCFMGMEDNPHREACALAFKKVIKEERRMTNRKAQKEVI